MSGTRVHRSAGESRGAIGRRQVHRGHVGELQACLFENGDCGVMRARSFRNSEPLAFEIGDRLDRRVRGNDDSFVLAGAGQGGNVQQVGCCGLRKDRRGVSGVTEIDIAGVERFEQRRPEGELDPLHGKAFFLQRRFEDAAFLHGRLNARLLEADADFLQVRRRGKADGRCRDRGEGKGEQRSTRRHHEPAPEIISGMLLEAGIPIRLNSKDRSQSCELCCAAPHWGKDCLPGSQVSFRIRR